MNTQRVRRPLHAARLVPLPDELHALAPHRQQLLQLHHLLLHGPAVQTGPQEENNKVDIEVFTVFYHVPFPFYIPPIFCSLAQKRLLCKSIFRRTVIK